ncbi:MAG: DegT/DnrJ/EryC1/StrS family aminotransferase [Terriglobia bacterium]
MNTTSLPTTRPQIPVAKPFLGSEEESAVRDVLRSGWIAQGPRVAEFEKRFAQYVGADHAIAVSSCTTALHLALLAAGVGARDEVICPSLSFIATANSIAYTGAAPVFVDIVRETYNLDPTQVEESITPKTRAILAVHQIGLPCAMDEICRIAARHDLVVVEDAACAIGSEYHDHRIGSPQGKFACFSFHPRKILTTGEGGMITTSDSGMAARLRQLRQHGMSVSDVVRHSARQVVIETYDEVGFNYRMTDLQAAVGIVQLGRLEDLLERRRSLAARYTARLQGLGWITAPHVPQDCRHNFQSYMVRLLPNAPMSRDSVMQELLEKGISTRRGVMAIHREHPYQDARWQKTLPETDAAAEETLILPLFHQMTEEEQDYVIGCIRDIGINGAR